MSTLIQVKWRMFDKLGGEIVVSRRFWTDDEVLYLEENWGTKSVKGIAKHLDRSVNSVKLKAQRIGLPDPRLAFEGITLNQLSFALNISYSLIKRWIKLYDFPAKRRVFSEKSRVHIVNYTDFWKWAEQNKQMIDFSRVEKHILGAEPSWVTEKRNADIIKKN